MISFDLIALEKVQGIVGRNCQIGNAIFPKTGVDKCVIDVWEFNGEEKTAYLIEGPDATITELKGERDIEQHLGSDWEAKFDQSHKPAPWQKAAGKN